MAISPPGDETDPQLVELRNQTPSDFEKTVAELWRAKGWNVRRTQTSKDGGVDVVATKGDTTLAIQAKRYGEANKVTEPDMRQYSSLRHDQENIDEVAVVTTGNFSKDAELYGLKNDIEMVDGDELVAQIEELDPISSQSSKTTDTTESGSVEPVVKKEKTVLRGWFTSVTVAAILFLIGGVGIFVVPESSVLGTFSAVGFMVGLAGLPVTIGLDAIHLKRHNANYNPSLIWAGAALMTMGFVGIWYWVRRFFHTNIKTAYR